MKKVTLARELEKNVSPAEHISTHTYITDGMSLVQTTNGDNMALTWVLQEAA